MIVRFLRAAFTACCQNESNTWTRRPGAPGPFPEARRSDGASRTGLTGDSDMEGKQHRRSRRAMPLYLRTLIGVALGGALGIAFGARPYLWGLRNEDLG